MNAVAPLSRVLKHLARRGTVSRNAVSGLERAERPKKAAKASKRILELDEIRKLLNAAEGRYRLIISVALNTGRRQSEILGLVWDNIDFKNGALRVDGQLERGRKEGDLWIPPHRVEYTKSDAGARTVTLIPSDLFKGLREHKMASSFKADDDLVFCTSEGKPLVHRNVSKRGFASAKDRAKLDVPGKPTLRFHDLRHTYASANIAAGVPVEWLSLQLGHEDTAFTWRTYVHELRREKAQESRNLLKASGYSGLV